MYSVRTPRCFYDLKQMLNLKKIGTHFQFNLWVYMVLSQSHHALEVALGCRASAIIYQNTRVYGDYQLIIAINASAWQLTVQPNATPRIHSHNSDCISKCSKVLGRALVTVAAPLSAPTRWTSSQLTNF